jgi:hypothetical protein
MAQTVIGLVVPRPIRSSTSFDAPTGPPPVTGEAQVCRATTPTMLARVTAVPHDRIGLGGQIAADLLPEADDSRAVEGGGGR